MGARQQLNNAWLVGCPAAAALVGVASGSWIVFGAALGLAVGAAVAVGNIRLGGTRR